MAPDRPTIDDIKSLHRTLLVNILNDLDKNGLTNIGLVHRFDSLLTNLRKSAARANNLELFSLMDEFNDFLAIVIQSGRQDGETAKKLRKSINERLAVLTENEYNPIYKPAIR